MYAIVWSKTRRVSVVAAGMEGKRLAMTVLAVLLSVCAPCVHPFSLLRQNRARNLESEPQRKLKQDLQNIWQPLQSTLLGRDNTLLKHSVTPLSDNTDSCFCLPSRSVYAGVL